MDVLFVDSMNQKNDGSSSWKRKLKIDHLLDRSTLQPFIFLTCFFFFSSAVTLIGARSYYLIIFSDLNVPMNPTLLAVSRNTKNAFVHIRTLIKGNWHMSFSLICLMIEQQNIAERITLYSFQFLAAECDLFINGEYILLFSCENIWKTFLIVADNIFKLNIVFIDGPVHYISIRDEPAVDFCCIDSLCRFYRVSWDRNFTLDDAG